MMLSIRTFYSNYNYAVIQVLDLFSSELFHKSIINTFVWYVILTGISAILAMVIAVLVHDFVEKDVLIIMILLTPIIIPSNALFSFCTLLAKISFNEANIWMILLYLWRFTGLYTTIYYIGLKTIDNDVIDSARIDGANWLQYTYNIRYKAIKHYHVLVLFAGCLAINQIHTDLIAYFETNIPRNLFLLSNYVFDSLRLSRFYELVVIETFFVIILIVTIGVIGYKYDKRE